MPRLSININDQTADALKELARSRETSVTDIVRRAVAVYKLVEDETNEGGKKLQFVDGADNVTSVALV